jgi:hypothetical protein
MALGNYKRKSPAKSRSLAKRVKKAAAKLVMKPKKTVSYKKGSDHNDMATVSKYRSSSKVVKKVSSAELYKQLRDNSVGVIKIVRQVTLSQKYSNTPYVTANDDRGHLLQFFTPARFKTFESIMFNNRNWSADSYHPSLPTPEPGVAYWDINIGASNIGANANLITYQPMIVHDSYVTFRLKNVSQHKSIVELFLFSGKGGQTASTVAPWDQYNASVKNDYRTPVGGFRGLVFTEMNNTLLESATFNKNWETERVVFKMEPGEEAFFKKQGPKTCVLNGKQHVVYNQLVDASNPVWLTPAVKGNGYHCMFRVLNDLTLVNATSGDGNVNLGAVKGGIEHPIHRQAVQAVAEPLSVLPFGGVVVEVNEFYKMGCPDESLSDNYKTPYKLIADERLTFTGSKVDIQVDADNSATIPAVPT